MTSSHKKRLRIITRRTLIRDSLLFFWALVSCFPFFCWFFLLFFGPQSKRTTQTPEAGGAVRPGGPRGPQVAGRLQCSWLQPGEHGDSLKACACCVWCGRVSVFFFFWGGGRGAGGVVCLFHVVFLKGRYNDLLALGMWIFSPDLARGDPWLHPQAAWISAKVFFFSSKFYCFLAEPLKG